MQHAIQIWRLLIELKELLVLQIFFVGLLRTQNHHQTLLHFFFWKLFLQALQIGWILHKLGINFCEIFVAFERAKPLDPAYGRRLHGRVIRKAIHFVLASSFLLFTLRVVILLLYYLLLLCLLLLGSCRNLLLLVLEGCGFCSGLLLLLSGQICHQIVCVHYFSSFYFSLSALYILWLWLNFLGFLGVFWAKFL